MRSKEKFQKLDDPRVTWLPKKPSPGLPKADPLKKPAKLPKAEPLGQNPPVKAPKNPRKLD